jgi:hypothetical protein
MIEQPRVIVNYSNQHRNISAVDSDPRPGPTTEEMIGERRFAGAKPEAERQGAFVIARHIAGVGTSSVDELVRELDWEFAQRPTHAASFHSDASGPQDVYPLIARPEDAAMAARIGRSLSRGIGFAYQAPKLRTDLAWSHRADNLPAGRTVLLEIGVHGATSLAYGQKGPAMLYRYAEFHGAAAIQECFREWGLLKVEKMLPRTIEVPPGFEDWYDPASPTPAPVEYAFGDRILYMDDDPLTPLMRGADVLLLQKALNALIPAGATITRLDDGRHAATPIDADGIFGGWTEAATFLYQSTHWWKGVRLVADGVCGPTTAAKIKDALAHYGITIS